MSRLKRILMYIYSEVMTFETDVLLIIEGIYLVEVSKLQVKLISYVFVAACTNQHVEIRS